MQLNFGTHQLEGQRMVKDLARELGNKDDLDRARLVMHSVISALRRRLGFDRAKHFMDHLPIPLQAMFVDNWEVEKETPKDLVGMEDFISEVQKSGTYLSDFVEVNDAIKATRAVFKIIGNYVAYDDMHAIRELLPADMRECL